ncbi:unnamed protein product, partial [Porites evermanni]
FGTNDNLNRSRCPSLFSAEPSGNNRQRDIPGYLHMRRNFFLQLLPDMEEVYYNGSTSDEDERAIFITQQNGTLNTGEDSPKAGGLENEGNALGGLLRQPNWRNLEEAGRLITVGGNGAGSLKRKSKKIKL